MRRIRRRLRFNYKPVFFKPNLIPMRELEQVDLSHEELETLRLRYLENKSQTVAAEEMGLSQSQYQRDMWEANRKIVDAIVNQKGIKIPN